ncbi:hypothetical protein BDW67DRAFT_18702 [Aspergillus spinulosporus]
MPPRKAARQLECLHSALTYDPSPIAPQVHYTQSSLQDRQEAVTPSSPKGIPAPPTGIDPKHFPAPLVLPGDDLALDPEHPPQSFQEWYDEKDRNPVTVKRRTVYLIGPPNVDKSAQEVSSWAAPTLSGTGTGTEAGSGAGGGKEAALNPPTVDDILPYISAFFHGLPVKKLRPPPSKWKFTTWTEAIPKKSKKVSYIALTTPKGEAIRIRTRPCPASDKLYQRQLNLDDLLDVAISILPDDAYALCMLVQHDLFEDDEDIFVCGRAYGGSRVAVVSTARYNPLLDDSLYVERDHAWPGSHCVSYIEDICKGHSHDDSETQSGRKRKRKKPKLHQQPQNRSGPLESALAAFTSTRPQARGEDLSALWRYRILRTVSHELTHCFGLDHCVYYACIMQGSASLAEDARQPPYLCPVDLAKLLVATGSSGQKRDQALLEYCEQPRTKDNKHFAALGAWLRWSLRLDSGSSSSLDGGIS